MTSLPITQGSIDIERIHQNESPAAHAGDPFPLEPPAAGVFRGEPQVRGQVGDGLPAATLERAIRDVERALRLLHRRRARLARLLGLTERRRLHADTSVD